MACSHEHKRFDYLLWGSLVLITVLYISHWNTLSLLANFSWSEVLAEEIYTLVNTMWWGMSIGILTIAALSKVPKEFVMAILGTGTGAGGIFRAALGGVLLDLCSHGILMVGAKLYERGASLGQLMAFLIASPWNSFSLTIILIALIGIKWTLVFIALSMLVALLTGIIFDALVKHKVLPSNPNSHALPKDFAFWPKAKQRLQDTQFDLAFFKQAIISGILESRMVMRWVLFGILLAGLVKTFVNTEMLQTYFGPTLFGLGSTILVATILEVCSEGSTPIAADILTRAKAPGNSFTFLMTGVSTDYTEIMVLKERTQSWKIALFLPLITLPQIVLLGWIINQV